MGRVEPRDWFEIKQFKDPVYGYIPVCRAYVKNLIDTQPMQRIKGVAQTGLRPVFSSATHDRFSHSLGVYKFGREMYRSLATRAYEYVEQTCCERWDFKSIGERENFLEKLKCRLTHWSTLLDIGCLLHDIGHPLQSHGFEFLYDDPYLDLEYDEREMVLIGDGIGKKERARVYGVLQEIAPQLEKPLKGNLGGRLLREFQKEGDPPSQNFAESLPGSPHERMSAYYIFQDRELRDCVEELVQISREKAKLPPDPKETALDLCFIARMIIGWEYPAEKQLEFKEKEFFYSLQNCVIRILNGPIDADGIDYLMRNSYAAGYDTSRVDSVRLCNAYTVYEENFVLKPAFSKSALSILEGYMSARNFEPKWLYSHHKVVYADLLTKQFYKYTTRYMTDRVMLLPSVKWFLNHASGSALVCGGEQDFGADLLFQKQKETVHLDETALHSHMENWSYPFYTYLLAPCRRYDIQFQYFYRSSDADLEALFHWMCSELTRYEGGDPHQRYKNYKTWLISGVLNRLPGEFWKKVSLKDLRTLLAENCLLELRGDGGDASPVLESWIQNGHCTEAISQAERQPKQLPALIELLTQAEKAAKGPGSQKRRLLALWLERYEPLLSESDFAYLLQLSEEYQTRRFRSSLWKSRAEYQLFLKDCAAALGSTPDDVDRYMTVLITEGMNQRCFSIFEGRTVKPPPLYEEQFYYLPYVQRERRQRMAAMAKSHTNLSGEAGRKFIAKKWAARIFTKTEQYDFSRNNLVVKFYGIKDKRFSKVKLLFGQRVVSLEDIFPYHKSGGRFPYFYYNAGANSGVSGIPSSFQDKFITFCRECRENEVRSETPNLSSSRMFRDAVYGDVEMTDPFYSVVCTREFQRLGRIRQLATADRSFPNATHTRLAHSLGTWHVMGMILGHFRELYKENPQLNFTDEDRDCALLAALLHDLGHGPYSHTVETVFGLDHEKMTRRMILDPDTEVHRVISDRFGQAMPERVCRLLDSKGDNGINLIYHSVISGQLDADRIDYLMRDNTACGMAFGHIDIQQLIASMRLMPDYREGRGGGRYRLCFDDRYLPAIEQFIYARYQMYKNVYHDSRKQLYEQIFDRLFRQAFGLSGAARKDGTFEILRRIRDGEEFSVAEYISLDDEAVNALLKKWADGGVLRDGDWPAELRNQARIVQLLSRAFLYRSPLFEQVELGGQRREYDLLAKRVGKHLGKNWTTFPVPENSKSQVDSCAFIYIQGGDCAYKAHDPETGSEKDIILRSMDNGTTCDYAQRSMFRSAQGTERGNILETDYCCLFYSRELLREECSMCGNADQTINAVDQTVDSAKPRKHIEIEKKFYCTGEQLKQAERYLDGKYGEKAKKSEKDQTDTYYDCPEIGQDLVLFDNRFSFRCREKEGRYTFTVKIPTDSPNYSSSSQFARHEHEFVSGTLGLTDEVWQFLIDTLELCGKSDLCDSLSRERMKPLLTVRNKRITYGLEGLCEICLDTVDYETAGPGAQEDKTGGRSMGERNYQIEIELLAEPEAWARLEEEVISPLVKELGEESLDFTDQSKLEKGMNILRN